MTTIQRKPDSTTPQFAADYEEATPQEQQPASCSSSVEVMIPPLVATVFAKSNEERKVLVNPGRIVASLETLERNRKFRKMGLA